MRWWLTDHRQNQRRDLWQQVSSYFNLLYSPCCPHNIPDFSQPRLLKQRTLLLSVKLSGDVTAHHIILSNPFLPTLTPLATGVGLI